MKLKDDTQKRKCGKCNQSFDTRFHAILHLKRKHGNPLELAYYMTKPVKGKV